ncbi:MAG TPA: alpha-glucan family phosphorylase [Streptosporangiaceae bacterium]|nr:alpha-glucan family phosphorylase [Streptosporangiaceae bacterium]
MRAIRRFTVRAALPESLAPLRDLTLNLRWSWHAETRDLFAAIDPVGWEASGHDPVALLGEVPPAQLESLGHDQAFLRRLDDAARDLDQYLSGPRWYQRYADGGSAGSAGGPSGPPAAIAYFSPEYGITQALPQYSGGLGILAGDHLKASSDLGVPLIGVGLLYRHGYFTQSLSPEGWQMERYPASDPNGLPLTLLRAPDGTAVRISVALAEGKLLAAQIWVAQVGRVPLLLLDSYVEENEPALREVTDRLYGGGGDHRLRQELLLGMGGVRAVRAFCALTRHAEPEVFHTNEGHAGFLGLERIREYAEQGLTFEEAIELCRAGTVFTTHTPVPAGIDRFSRDLVERHFSGAAADPALPTDRVLALGAETFPGGDPSVFNMAVMGMRLAQRVNGVSQLHGEVSREMFAGLWPGFDTGQVPIGSVTNGVHAPTWVAQEVLDLASTTPEDSAVAQQLPEDGHAWERVAHTAPARLWEIRRALRGRLVAQARERLRASWRQRGASEAELAWTDEVLDENVLTIGFARRVPSYKRLTLILHDQARLTELMLDPERPVQFIIAGKAHPADDGGKRLIQQMVQFADDPRVRHRIVFLPDYDMAMARALVQGCDVWLNNPLRPLEACGTSGMKAALNGGLNLSIRDGWWDEWYDGADGWAIPSADGVEDPERRDELESNALYDLLGLTVAPRFYDTGPDGLPRRWLEMVGHTLRALGPRVQASRMVRQYVEELYIPAARASRALSEGVVAADSAVSTSTGPASTVSTSTGRPEPFAAARELAAWKRRVTRAWGGVRIDHVEGEDGDQGPGGSLVVRATVALGGLSPDDVSVEVVYGRVGDADEILNPAVSSLTIEDGPEDGVARFVGKAELGRPGPFGYTLRVVPRHRLLASAAEMGLVTLPEAPAGLTTGDLR